MNNSSHVTNSYTAMHSYETRVLLKHLEVTNTKIWLSIKSSNVLNSFSQNKSYNNCLFLIVVIHYDNYYHTSTQKVNMILTTLFSRSLHIKTLALIILIWWNDVIQKSMWICIIRDSWFDLKDGHNYTPLTNKHSL